MQSSIQATLRSLLLSLAGLLLWTLGGLSPGAAAAQQQGASQLAAWSELARFDEGLVVLDSAANSIERFAIIDPKEEIASIDLSRLFPGNRTLLVGGLPARLAASMVVIGPSVFLTAAHVLIADPASYCGQGKPEEFEVRVKSGALSFDSRCMPHPAFCQGTSNRTADLVLCRIPPPTAVPGSGEPFAGEANFVNFDTSLVLPGRELHLSGFGCLSWNPQKGGLRRFRRGRATVLAGPSRSYPHAALMQGGSALCDGDSGGAVFYEAAGKRWVVGVGIQGAVDGDVHCSLIAPLSHPETAKWLRQWSDDGERRICGLSLTDEKDCQPWPPP